MRQRQHCSAVASISINEMITVVLEQLVEAASHGAPPMAGQVAVLVQHSDRTDQQRPWRVLETKAVSRRLGLGRHWAHDSAAVFPGGQAWDTGTLASSPCPPAVIMKQGTCFSGRCSSVASVITLAASSCVASGSCLVSAVTWKRSQESERAGAGRGLKQDLARTLARSRCDEVTGDEGSKAAETGRKLAGRMAGTQWRRFSTHDHSVHAIPVGRHRLQVLHVVRGP